MSLTPWGFKGWGGSQAILKLNQRCVGALFLYAHICRNIPGESDFQMELVLDFLIGLALGLKLTLLIIKHIRKLTIRIPSRWRSQSYITCLIPPDHLLLHTLLFLIQTRGLVDRAYLLQSFRVSWNMWHLQLVLMICSWAKFLRAGRVSAPYCQKSHVLSSKLRLKQFSRNRKINWSTVTANPLTPQDACFTKKT